MAASGSAAAVRGGGATAVSDSHRPLRSVIDSSSSRAAVVWVTTAVRRSTPADEDSTAGASSCGVPAADVCPASSVSRTRPAAGASAAGSPTGSAVGLGAAVEAVAEAVGTASVDGPASIPVGVDAGDGGDGSAAAGSAAVARARVSTTATVSPPAADHAGCSTATPSSSATAWPCRRR